MNSKLNKEFLWSEIIRIKKPSEKQQITIQKKSKDKKNKRKSIKNKKYESKNKSLKEKKTIENKDTLNQSINQSDSSINENHIKSSNSSDKKRNFLSSNKVFVSRAEFLNQNYKNFLSLVKDESLLGILKEFKEKDLIKFEEGPQGNSQKEAEKYVKEKVIDYFKDSYESLKYQNSVLRRKGIDTKMIDFKLMSIPLKIKIFKSTFHKDDFDKLVGLIEKIKQEIKSHNSNQ